LHQVYRGIIIRESRGKTAPSLRDSVGKTTLRALGELCGSAVIDLSQEFHRRDAEHAELTLEKQLSRQTSVRRTAQVYIWAISPPASLLLVLWMHFFLDTEKASATIRANTRKEVIQSNDKTKTWWGGWGL